MTDTERKPQDQTEKTVAQLEDADLEQASGGKPDIHDIPFTKPIDKSSPVFFQT